MPLTLVINVFTSHFKHTHTHILTVTHTHTHTHTLSLSLTHTHTHTHTHTFGTQLTCCRCYKVIRVQLQSQIQQLVSSHSCLNSGRHATQPTTEGVCHILHYLSTLHPNGDPKQQSASDHFPSAHAQPCMLARATFRCNIPVSYKNRGPVFSFQSFTKTQNRFSVFSHLQKHRMMMMMMS